MTRFTADYQAMCRSSSMLGRNDSTKPGKALERGRACGGRIGVSSVVEDVLKNGR
jgi:hypothetical protein